MYLFLRFLISPLDVTHLAWIHVLKKSKKWPSAYIVAEAHCWNIELLLFTHRMFRNHGNTKNHLILYLRYASFSYKKTLVKESESFFKVDLCYPTILQSLSFILAGILSRKFTFFYAPRKKLLHLGKTLFSTKNTWHAHSRPFHAKNAQKMSGKKLP